MPSQNNTGRQYDKQHAITMVATAELAAHRFIAYDGGYPSAAGGPKAVQGIAETAAQVGDALSVVTSYSYLLVCSEALAVGDQHFQKKCIERIQTFRDHGCTILFCSHSPYHVRHLCDVALWLDGGRAMELGSTEAVLSAYEKHTRLLSAPAQDDAPTAVPAPGQAASPYERGPRSAMILDCQIADLAEPAVDDSGAPRLLDSPDLVATITVRGKAGERPNIGFMIEQDRGVGITSLATHEEGAVPTEVEPGVWRSVLRFPALPLHSGDYVVSVFLFDESGLVTYDLWFKFLRFRFVSPTLMPGLVRLPHQWS